MPSKISRSLSLLVLIPSATALNNGLAEKPPMGWCSWNAFHRNWNESLFYRVTDQMSTNGMQAAGYEYINVDGGWWQGSDTGTIVRNESGFLVPAADKYPRGLGALIDYVHSKGFKYGHYTDAGEKACNKDGPMSQGFEHQDARLFASLGVDMVKVDACYVTEENHTIVSRWEKELNATGRPILFSNCHNGCVNDPQGNPYIEGWADWCQSETNMARSSRDIVSTWGSVMFNLQTLRGLGSHGGPGFWNDPDFLEVGVGDFVAAGPEANRAHFAAWCVTSSPLIASPDFDAAHDYVVPLLTDRDAIAVNQEYAGNAGDLLEEQGGRIQICTKMMTAKQGCRDVGMGQVWHKPLLAGATAVVLLNTQEATPNATSVSMNVSFSLLPALGSDAHACTVFDIWTKKTVVLDSEFTAEVPPMSSKFLRISGCQTAISV